LTQRISGELADLAERLPLTPGVLLACTCQALRRAAAKARDLSPTGGGGRRGAFPRAVNKLTEPLEVTGRIAAQTRQR